VLPFPRWKGELARRDRVRHDRAARYTASRGRVQGWARTIDWASGRRTVNSRRTRATPEVDNGAVATSKHPLDAKDAERS